jgi:hypothetical protein
VRFKDGTAHYQVRISIERVDEQIVVRAGFVAPDKDASGE